MRENRDIMSDKQVKGNTKRGPIHLGTLTIPRSVLSIAEKLLILGILALAVFYLLPRFSSLEDSLDVLAQMNPWLIASAFLAQIFSYFGNGMTISECVKLTQSKFSAIYGMLIAMASASVGLVAGGMFGSTANTFRWVKAGDSGSQGAALAATLPPIFLDLVLLGVSLVGLVFLLLTHELARSQIIAFSVLTLLLILLTVLLILANKHQQAAVQRILKIMQGIYSFIKKDFDESQMQASLEKLFASGHYLLKGGWKGPTQAAGLNIIMDMLTLYLVFLASGRPVSVLELVAGYSLPWLIGRLAFIFPGGVGIIESTMVAMFVSLGIERATATVAVLVYRVISFWIPSLLGFVVLPVLNAIKSEEA